MSKRTIKKTVIAKSNSVKDKQVSEQIKALEEAIAIKKNQTSVISEEIEKQLEVNNTENEVINEPEKTPLNETEPVNEVNTLTEQKETVTEPEIKSNVSLVDDFIGVTQEDLNKKDTVFSESNDDKTAFEERAENLTSDDFVTNEGATEEEDTPEYRREMAKIQASALVEFFDVIFMLICLGISKDFSDDAQKRFSLVAPRKNAIKANIFQILVFKKKKYNPMSTVVMLVLFSYVPLIAIAIMNRVKKKKEEQEQARQLALMKIQNQNNIQQLPAYNTVFNPDFAYTENQKPKKVRKPKDKIVQVVKSTGAEVKQLKNGDYKNLSTGEIYKGGRGRKPKWLTQYFGKIG